MQGIVIDRQQQCIDACDIILADIRHFRAEISIQDRDRVGHLLDMMNLIENSINGIKAQISSNFVNFDSTRQYNFSEALKNISSRMESYKKQKEVNGFSQKVS